MVLNFGLGFVRSSQSVLIIFTDRIQRMGEGNVFTGACHSVHWGRGYVRGRGVLHIALPEISRDTINRRSVRILLKCILVPEMSGIVFSCAYGTIIFHEMSESGELFCMGWQQCVRAAVLSPLEMHVRTRWGSDCDEIVGVHANPFGCVVAVVGAVTVDCVNGHLYLPLQKVLLPTAYVVWRKVIMFSQASVCPRGGGGVRRGGCLVRGGYVPGQSIHPLPTRQASTPLSWIRQETVNRRSVRILPECTLV